MSLWYNTTPLWIVTRGHKISNNNFRNFKIDFDNRKLDKAGKRKKCIEYLKVVA